MECFRSALWLWTGDRKTGGHNYPVCSEVDAFYYLNLSGQGNGAERRGSLPFSCHVVFVSVNAQLCNLFLFCLRSLLPE